ncbi:hypothetical protein [Halorubrum ezzemoulense]|uniref:hypothetical protein n=1 Tax=Halorubrum ezzemoulense TaxID=337243 RepID=UPI000B98E5F0|nr:hypothetical protein [Halorubrum ezzemoulense]
MVDEIATITTALEATAQQADTAETLEDPTPTDFLVGECKNWHQTPVQQDAVEAIALRAALARAMPVLAVARRVTASA